MKENESDERALGGVCRVGETLGVVEIAREFSTLHPLFSATHTRWFDRFYAARERVTGKFGVEARLLRNLAAWRSLLGPGSRLGIKLVACSLCLMLPISGASGRALGWPRVEDPRWSATTPPLGQQRCLLQLRTNAMLGEVTQIGRRLFT